MTSTTSAGTRAARDARGDVRAVLEQVIASGPRIAFQPIVDLGSALPVGFEALARGPEGTPLATPLALFDAARTHGRLAALDWSCRMAAQRAACAGGLVPPWWLTVNVEPEALGRLTPSDFSSAALAGAGQLELVVELTERALTLKPAELVATVTALREQGLRIALDDVGAERESLALLPLLRPDIIKLDLRLVQTHPSADIAEIVGAVNAEAERTGALILAEGIETDQHVEVALALGASLGQGWRYGRPGPLPKRLGQPTASRLPRRPAPLADVAGLLTPFEAVTAVRAPRESRKALLIEMSKHLERQALAQGSATVVLSTFQHARHFTRATVLRYEELAASAAFVGALGAAMDERPAEGVRGALLDEYDPIRHEWDVVVLGPHQAAALVAHDLGDTGPDLQRRFSYVLTHDRELAVRAANALMARIAPAEPRMLGEIAGTFPASPARPARPAGRCGLPSPSRTATGGATAGVPAQLSQELQARALDATTDAIVIADATAPDLPLVYANAGFERLTGYSADEVAGLNCRFLQGPGTDEGEVLRISAALRGGRAVHALLRNYRKDGTAWWNELRLSPVHGRQGQVTHYIGVQQDVTARVEAERRVQHLAFHDPLTELLNRAGLEERLHVALASGEPVALLVLDLDDFKAVNHGHGHALGDELLRLVAARLRRAIRLGDAVARQGGDEFLLVATDLPEDPDEADRVMAGRAQRVVDALAEPFEVQGRLHRLGGSVGVAIAPFDAGGAGALFDRADRAMYRAKAAGGHRWLRHRAVGGGTEGVGGSAALA